MGSLFGYIEKGVTCVIQGVMQPINLVSSLPVSWLGRIISIAFNPGEASERRRKAAQNVYAQVIGKVSELIVLYHSIFLIKALQPEGLNNLVKENNNEKILEIFKEVIYKSSQREEIEEISKQVWIEACLVCLDQIWLRGQREDSEILAIDFAKSIHPNLEEIAKQEVREFKERHVREGKVPKLFLEEVNYTQMEPMAILKFLENQELLPKFVELKNICEVDCDLIQKCFDAWNTLMDMPAAENYGDHLVKKMMPAVGEQYIKQLSMKQQSPQTII